MWYILTYHIEHVKMSIKELNLTTIFRTYTLPRK